MKANQTLGASGFAILALLAPFLNAQESTSPLSAHSSSAEMKKLVAIIRPIGNSNVRGSVVFDKVDDGILINAKIGGLTPNAHHAIHIHEFGDLGSEDASSAGDHFNPGDHSHAIPDESERHAGDLGNLQADGDGNAVLTLVVNNITLDAGKRGIIGRAVIVHAKADDGGQPSGNAGDRIAAGVIGISKDARPEPAPPTPKPPGEGKPAEPEQKETRPTTPDTDVSVDE
ncbi:superoxide dismutase family protein [Luteolibacter arcticus]|uniref:Superoxide dismutase family protein n=1 Tax=Luteolibacter arcticus TaxID=1581411 RepID=A0ABT3GHV7_9BACT|nr:superoxide dismutase family protein [Luteolibacter arcticus]MCW1923091.1 superoxide dismutase family protein [Luteolibacter arcticus]